MTTVFGLLTASFNSCRFETTSNVPSKESCLFPLEKPALIKWKTIFSNKLGDFKINTFIGGVIYTASNSFLKFSWLIYQGG